MKQLINYMLNGSIEHFIFGLLLIAIVIKVFIEIIKD